jgi:hypothetical protein
MDVISIRMLIIESSEKESNIYDTLNDGKNNIPPLFHTYIVYLLVDSNNNMVY